MHRADHRRAPHARRGSADGVGEDTLLPRSDRDEDERAEVMKLVITLPAQPALGR
jgi:hypothetical protein